MRAHLSGAIAFTVEHSPSEVRFEGVDPTEPSSVEATMPDGSVYIFDVMESVG